jgi:phage repressor protein C with HTH and peptisase S24 domain
MSPTYKDGDWLLVSWIPAGLTSLVGDRILGKVIVIEREERPGIFLVKRLQKSHGGIYWVQGDNDESTDSRTWGWIPGNEIVGVVRMRIKITRTNKKRS